MASCSREPPLWVARMDPPASSQYTDTRGLCAEYRLDWAEPTVRVVTPRPGPGEAAFVLAASGIQSAGGWPGKEGSVTRSQLRRGTGTREPAAALRRWSLRSACIRAAPCPALSPCAGRVPRGACLSRHDRQPEHAIS